MDHRYKSIHDNEVVYKMIKILDKTEKVVKGSSIRQKESVKNWVDLMGERIKFLSGGIGALPMMFITDRMIALKIMYDEKYGD